MAPSIEFVIRIVFMRIKSRMKNCMSVMQPDVVYNMYALQPASQHSTYYIIPIYLCALIQFFSVFRLFYFFIPSFLLILRVFGQNTFIFDWIRMKVDYCGAIVSGKTPSRNQPRTEIAKWNICWLTVGNKLQLRINQILPQLRGRK